ncbi:hypothetical protein ABBQ32_009209 [Trebouxia sp. C0010 RCD-2024]
MCSTDVKSGSEFYAKLYPEKSSDGVLRLGNVVPDFKADTTHGPIEWHKWIDGKWAILFSHPADFTVSLLAGSVARLWSIVPARSSLEVRMPLLLLQPVCTTEIGRLALKYDELEKKGVKLATLSADPVEIKFPIIGDADRSIAVKYGMLDPTNKDKDDLPLTIRAVFIIGPDKKLKLSLNYPASVGRNMDEIVRCVDALQLSAKHSVANWLPAHDSIQLGRTRRAKSSETMLGSHVVEKAFECVQATPANWPHNHDSIGKKGWAFLLPTVTPEDAKLHFPGHHSCQVNPIFQVPSGVDYLRLTDVSKLTLKT